MQMVDRAWLNKWNACWREGQIKALGVDSMSASDIVRNSHITNSHKQWVICRLLVEQSRADLVTYANFCRDSAKKHADAATYAAVDDAAADAAAYATDDTATYAAAYAANAADAATYAADAAADAAADTDAIDKEHQKNLEFALTLLK